jgi:hypothetical protein
MKLGSEKMCLSFVTSLIDRRLCVEMIHFTRLGLILLDKSGSEILRRNLKGFLNGSEYIC